MTSFTHMLTALRHSLANLEDGFDRLTRIQFSAPWRAAQRCGR